MVAPVQEEGVADADFSFYCAEYHSECKATVDFMLEKLGWSYADLYNAMNQVKKEDV